MNLHLYGARRGIPAHPRLHLALDHPGLDAVMVEVAERYRYELLEASRPRGALTVTGHVVVCNNDVDST